MVRSSTLVLVLTSALSGFVAANSCRNGGIYCGKGLLDKGNYITKIKTGLQAKAVDPSDFNVANSLWSCGDNGDIEYKDLCSAGCVPNGHKDDACEENEAAEEAGDAAADAAEAAAAARKRAVGKAWAA